MEDLPDEIGHKCIQCEFTLDEEGSEVFDNLIELEKSLTLDTKMALLYIAGYVTRKDTEVSESGMLDVTTFYSQKYGSYTNELDRGQLNIPDDCASQWTFFSYIVFLIIKEKVCRKSLMQVLMMISDHYNFGMLSVHARILSNVLLNNYCSDSTPRSSKEAGQKVLKLS